MLLERVRIDGEREPPGEAERAQHAQVVLGEALRRASHGAQHAALEVVGPAEGVVQLVAQRVPRDRVDREVPAREVVLQAAVRAKKAGFDQVLWLDHKEHSYVEEVGTMNLFAVFGDTLVTPPLSDSILAGITRDSILALAASLGVKTEQRRISIKEIFEGQKSGLLKEVFGSGTAAVVSPAVVAFRNSRRSCVLIEPLGTVAL